MVLFIPEESKDTEIPTLSFQELDKKVLLLYYYFASYGDETGFDGDLEFVVASRC